MLVAYREMDTANVATTDSAVHFIAVPTKSADRQDTAANLFRRGELAGR